MVRTVSTTHRSTVTLHDGREVRIVVRFGEPSPPEALPISADVILHALGDDLDDAVAVAEALQDVLLPRRGDAAAVRGGSGQPGRDRGRGRGCRATERER